MVCNNTLYRFMAVKVRDLLDDETDEWEIAEGYLSANNFANTLKNYPPEEGWEISIYKEDEE